MKVFMLVLLVSLLFVEGAHTLMCFTCNQKKDIFGCLKISFCTLDENYCISQIVSSRIEPKQQTVTKSCAVICPISASVSEVVAMTSRCCKSSLCNVFLDDGRFQASSLVLGLSVLFSLLYTLVRPGA